MSYLAKQHFDHIGNLRNSVSNLITITPSKTAASIVTPNASLTHYQKTSSCMGLHMASQSTPHSTLNTTTTSITSSSSTILPQLSFINSSMDTSISGSNAYNKKHLLGDNSPYKEMEVLSLQMTEQAIN